jgi:hypothetical protein
MELDTFIESHKEVRWEFLRAADPINKESEWLIALTATACSFYWLEFLSRLNGDSHGPSLTTFVGKAVDTTLQARCSFLAQ